MLFGVERHDGNGTHLSDSNDFRWFFLAKFGAGNQAGDFIFKAELSEELLPLWEKERAWAIETGKIDDDNGKTDFESLLRRDLMQNAG